MKVACFLAVAITSAFTAAAPAQQPDFSKAEIKITDLGNHTFMLEGVGGNITVAAGTDAVIMIDAQYGPLHDKIKAAVNAATNELPIR